MGGNKSGKTSSDILPLYFDKYKTHNAPPITEEDRDILQAEMAAMNAATSIKETD